MAAAPPMPTQVFLIHGNNEPEVNSARFELVRRLLPHGEEDGEIVDIRGPGNQPLKLEKCVEEIIQELGTVSLIADARRVVVVHDLSDFRDQQKGSVRAARKEKKANPVDRLADYLANTLPQTENTLVFVYAENDDKGRYVAKSSPLYEMAQRLGEVREFSERRIDWTLEDALLARNLNLSVRLLREWNDRGSQTSFRIVSTLNNFLQLLLQARLQFEGQRDGVNTANLFPTTMRPSIASTPQFKAGKYRALARQFPLPRLRSAIRRLDTAQKCFFPTGEELVVHDPMELVETMVAELFRAETG
ncbi:hypothetical protein HZA57_09860 [Candidatus Poribacteria bacterium]|nr:hypothetical protein [Candidatus Poribacteria bacterium]